MDAVTAAFDAVPRTWFLPESDRSLAGLDAPVQIGHGQTNSQPRTVEAMLRLLEPQRGDRVLDVGSGSGWTTALLANLVGPAGRVTGVEVVPALVAWGRANLASAESSWAAIEQAEPDALGWPALAPYDRILVSAEARDLPAELLEQLADPGRMVVPVGSTMTLVERTGGRDRVTSHGAYRFVPLIGP